MTYPGSTTFPGLDTFPGTGATAVPPPEVLPPGLTGTLQPLPVTWEIDGLTLGTTDEFACTWYVTSSNGWFGPAKPKTHRSAKFQTQGSFRSLAPRGERIIALTGSTRCPDIPSRLGALDRFAAIAADPARVYTLTVNDQRGYPRTIGVELDALTDVKLVGPRWFDWQLQFGCPDPRKHDASWQSPACGPSLTGSAGVDFSSNLNFNSNLGLDFGTPGTASTAQVANFGTTTAYPVLQVTGPCINPIITDLANGVQIGYAGSLVAGETLTINCDDFTARGFPPKSCYLNTVQNRRSQLVLTMLWPQVGAGEVHDFSFSAGGTNTATTTLTVYLRAAWM